MVCCAGCSTRRSTSKRLAVRAAEMFRNQPVNEADFPDNHAWIDFRGPPGTFPQYSFSDVMAGSDPGERVHRQGGAHR